MKPLVCFYCDGSDTKLAVITKEKDVISVIKTVTVSMTSTETDASIEQSPDLGMESSSNGISFDSLDDTSMGGDEAGGSDISMLASSLADVKLSNSHFIPIVTEPSVTFHVYEGEKGKDKNQLLDLIIDDINKSKAIYVEKDLIDCVKLDENSHLSAFLDANVPCIDLLYALASYNGKRYYKIETIKSAEIALANYIARSTKFFPEDYSLVIHIGKETSKLIFLEGQKLKHIGSTLDIGTQNLHTYDVYFSKILLEMENGDIPRLDNVVLCGDDRSENLVLSFYGTFPEANVIELKFDAFNLSALEALDAENISSYAVPLAAAYEFYGEQEKEIEGINILPKYIVEHQKFLQFGWHSYLMLVVLFVTTFLFTFFILDKNKEIEQLDNEVTRLVDLQQKNEEIVSQITPLSNKIASFDNTRSILDSASIGTGVWGDAFESYSNFLERRRNFWFSHIESEEPNKIQIKGYSLSRASLTEFSRASDASVLRSVLYEPLRERNTFSFLLNVNLTNRITK